MLGFENSYRYFFELDFYIDISQRFIYRNVSSMRAVNSDGRVSAF